MNITDEQLASNLARENIQVAPRSKRMTAFMIDELLIQLLLLVIFWSDIQSGITDMQAFSELANQMVGTSMILVLFYHSLFTCIYGGTLGKIFVGIMVVNKDDFSRLSFPMALFRSIIRVVNGSFLYLGSLWAFFDPFNRTVHEMTSKSLVVQAWK